MGQDFICDTCHIGMMQPLLATYATWLDGTLVVLPNVEGWLCDVCGEFTQDAETVTRTELLLGIHTSTLHESDTASRDQPSHKASPPILPRGRAS